MALHILLVEDNPKDVELTRLALAETGAQTELSLVENGLDGLNFLLKQGPYEQSPKPDLILLDLGLPGMDGLELLKTIKQHEQLSLTPVVVLSGRDTPKDIQALYDMHANCYIKKPLEKEAFLAAIRSIENFWTELVRLPGPMA